MAGYYSKVFPDIQQKAISGFLTTLWNQEPCRNRWALIAKVYSFIRDDVKHGRISLAEFLGVCCPMMKIIDPSIYLSSLGWMVRHDIDGSPFLVRDPYGATITHEQLDAHMAPTTESDILKGLLNVNYLPEDSNALIARINANSNPMMATTPVPTTAQKRQFINTIRRDATQATRELFGQHFDEQVMHDHGYRVHNANDLGAIGHLPMALPPRVPTRPYQATTTLSQLELTNNRTVVNWDPIPEHDPFDLNNPFALDHLMGFTQMEEDQSKSSSSHSKGESNDLLDADLPPSPPYRSDDDFHFNF